MAIFAAEPGLAGCSLDSPSRFIPRLYIMFGEAQTLSKSSLVFSHQPPSSCRLLFTDSSAHSVTSTATKVRMLPILHMPNLTRGSRYGTSPVSLGVIDLHTARDSVSHFGRVSV